MTLSTIQAALPHGFHDAFLCALSVDYLQRRATLEIEVWVGDLHAGERSRREAYRRGRLNLEGLLLVSCDVPDREWLDDRPHGLGIDALAWQDAPPPARGGDEAPIPDGAFACAFVFTTVTADTYLHVAALEACWTWVSETRLLF